jgi:hypothetical protein
MKRVKVVGRKEVSILRLCEEEKSSSRHRISGCGGVRLLFRFGLHFRAQFAKGQRGVS